MHPDAKETFCIGPAWDDRKFPKKPEGYSESLAEYYE